MARHPDSVYRSNYSEGYRNGKADRALGLEPSRISLTAPALTLPGYADGYKAGVYGRPADNWPIVSELPWTLADHAEAWGRDTGRVIPARGTKEWEGLFREWQAWALRGEG